MVLAAGLGLRMRPITNTIPKPLVSVAGKTLLDWGLDTLAASGVRKAVVNVHYFPEQIVAHVKSRSVPVISISDESDGLLDSAGGIVKALPLLGADPFFILNADTFWIDAGRANLDRLADAWRPGEMDALLLLAGYGVSHGPQWFDRLSGRWGWTPDARRPGSDGSYLRRRRHLRSYDLCWRKTRKTLAKLVF
jgi:MurNAc alpha-1-phosphate uridylyltransferase